ncbi:J domain-containing protein [Agaribacterium haliotis]|uniref:J domain-containing protein n=1 Tax=Agaribacterium haliotis TaxID=2013869 RepID=UPI000BB530E2|nr:J domain-containing protein [Agaribacterium haliotis]
MLHVNYHILGLCEQATDDELKKAWRRLSALYHPDRCDQKPLAAEMFKLVQRAYSELCRARAAVPEVGAGLLAGSEQDECEPRVCSVFTLTRDQGFDMRRDCRRRREGSRSDRRFHWQLPEQYIGTQVKCSC